MKPLDSTYGNDRIDGFTFGSGRQVLIMLHASGTGAGSLIPLATRAAETGWRVLVPNLDGYGGTRIRDGAGHAMQRHERVVRHLLQGLDAAPTVFGHSMGGLLALRLASARSDDSSAPFRTLTVVEPVAMGVLREYREDQPIVRIDEAAIDRISPLMRAGKPEEAIRDFITLWNGVDWDTIPDKVRAGIVALAPQIDAETSSVRHDAGWAARYSRISVPVKLAGTERGPAPAARILDRLQRAIPNVRRVLVAGAGHMGPVQQPDLFHALLPRLPATGR